MALNFQIQRISANSDLPLRDAEDNFVLGGHVLWEPIGGALTLSPNIFAHDFINPIASAVTVAIITSGDLDNPEYQYRLRGSVGGIIILESDLFVPTQLETDIPVTVVAPANSNRPFAWNADFTWTLERDGTVINHDVDTHLELYWISQDIHEIFLGEIPGIPITLLRIVIPNLALEGLAILGVPVQADNAFNPTNLTFTQFNKTYDTTEGDAHFGVGGIGGNFHYRNYIAALPNGQPGSLQPVVNCCDQAAMTQVVESFSHLAADRGSWLYMDPVGYILPTNLIGVPGPCNNPFFMRNGSQPLVAHDDPLRTRFGCHVFNGLLPTWDPALDRISDACTGPRIGDATQAYVDVSVDGNLALYPPNRRPGTVDDIFQLPGIGLPEEDLPAAPADPPPGPPPGAVLAAAVAPDPVVVVAPPIIPAPAVTIASNGVETLILNSASHQPGANIFLQNHWDDVPTWINTVAGANTSIAFHSTNFGNGGSRVHELWHLSGVAHGIDGGDLVLQISVHTAVSSNGTLDIQKASAAALDHLRYELKNTDMDLGPDDELLKTLWEPSLVGQEYSQYAMQLSPNVPRGHIMIVSGNTVIDLYGGSSSASLEPLVRKLLSHTTISRPISLSIPKESSHQFNIPTPRRGSKENAVTGVGTSFTVICQLPHPVSVASAIAKDKGVLLKNHTIKGNAEESSITFEFVTFKIGIHDVDLLFATTHMLTGGKEGIQVVVEEAS